MRLQLQSNLMYTSYIKQTPNSILAASFLMDFNSRIEKKETQELYSNLSEENKQSYYGKSIKKYLSNKSFDAGEKLNDFKLINTVGKKIRLSEVKGEYILLDFWASWCAGCREEFPRLIKTYQLYKNNGFNVIGISLDINKNDWLNAIKADQLPWENVGDLKGFNSKIALGYGITGLPEKLLIDKKGTIIGKIESLYQLEEKLKELYK